MNLVFLAYNAVDIGYAARVLAFGALPAGVTTQTYAHRGAFWLTVALALVTVVLGVLFRGPLAIDPRARTARRLAAAWIAQSGVLALGTAFRLALHVHVSGISDLRFVGALGTALVAVGLALVGWKIRANLSFRWLLERQLGAFVAAVALYALVPTHLLSANHNVPRLLAGDYGPLVHVRAEASEVESAALLVPLLHHADPRVRQGVAVLLRREEARLTGSWDDASHVSYAKVKATQELAAARPTLDENAGGRVHRSGRRHPQPARRFDGEWRASAHACRSRPRRRIPLPLPSRVRGLSTLPPLPPVVCNRERTWHGRR